MADTVNPDDEGFGPFPSTSEMVRHHVTLLESELDETNAELRNCRQRIAILVVQHGKDQNELARLKADAHRLTWELSTARLQLSQAATAKMTFSYGDHGAKAAD